MRALGLGEAAVLLAALANDRARERFRWGPASVSRAETRGLLGVPQASGIRLSSVGPRSAAITDRKIEDMGLFGKKLEIPSAKEALPGREERMPVAGAHVMTGEPLDGPFEGYGRIMLAMGCFWGVERKFWQVPGVVSTSVGYVNGHTPNPTYNEVCSGRTGHTEAVRAFFDKDQTSFEDLLRAFWEGHDPTQGMRQGNDQGTQYRSGLYYYDDEQNDLALRSREMCQEKLTAAGFGEITTEIQPAPEYYFAEDYHQQYLAKNPNGYCGVAGTGVSCPIGLATD